MCEKIESASTMYALCKIEKKYVVNLKLFFISKFKMNLKQF